MYIFDSKTFILILIQNTTHLSNIDELKLNLLKINYLKKINCIKNRDINHFKLFKITSFSTNPFCSHTITSCLYTRKIGIS